MLTIGIAILVAVLLMMLGLPVAFSFGLATVYIYWVFGLTPHLAISTCFQTISGFTILCIPFFIYAGDLMGKGGISKPLIDFSQFIFGRIRGSMGHTAILANTIFGAITGSAVAGVAAIGSIMLPRLVEEGYDKRYATALVTASSVLGILIPPSVPLLLFASLVPGSSIKELFIAGVLPGITLALLFMITNYFYCSKVQSISARIKTGTGEPRGGSKGRPLYLDAIPALAMPLIMLGGIYSGVFTATEAAGVACIYAIIVSPLCYRGLTLRSWGTVTLGSASASAAILCVLMFVSMFNMPFVTYQAPQKLASFMLGVLENKVAILFVIDIILIILGMFMEPITIMVVIAPLFLPLMSRLNVDMNHYALILTVGTGVGLMTPPVAPTLWVGAKISGLSIADFMQYSLVFIIIQFGFLLVITYVPIISTFLPSLIR